MLQIEFEFTLPCGYVDDRGNLHRRGVMRRATAIDEIEPLSHPRVRSNEAYFGILLLSRVIMRLGSIDVVGPELVERLFATDFLYLQDLYTQINSGADGGLVETACPRCGTHFMLDLGAQDA